MTESSIVRAIFDPDPWATILAGSEHDRTAISVRDYAALCSARQSQRIAEMIQLRFTERYITPALDNPRRHGFSMLATGCLLVEALESFRNGWKRTNGCPGGGEKVFRSFFLAHDEFRDLGPVAEDFYKHVRCGILHQAETTGSWRVDRRVPLFSETAGTRRIGAAEFVKRLGVVLRRYTDDLAAANWRDPAWRKARRKLRHICRACGLSEADAARLQ